MAGTDADLAEAGGDATASGAAGRRDLNRAQKPVSDIESPGAETAIPRVSPKALSPPMFLRGDQPTACRTAIQSGAVATKARVETTIAVLTSPGRVW